MYLLTGTSLFVGVKGFINAMCAPPWLLALSVAGLAAFLRWYRQLTRPAVAIPVAVVVVLGFLASCLDPHFRRLVTRADNVPIVMMIGLIGYFLWLSFRQAAKNDRAMEKGKPPLEAGVEDRVLVWPDVVFVELILLVLCVVFLIVWAIILPAPLEQPADPGVAPNPAKLPWSLVGLQEMLVYFDAWLAGVVIPGLIILGLIAIPYIDKNPRGNGYYTFKERPFAVGAFLFGFVGLWLMLTICGTFLRGPNWDFFGPFEHWDAHRPVGLLNVEFHDLFWTSLLGQAPPEHHLLRELPGLVLLGAYFLLGPPVLRVLFFRRIHRQIGPLRYGVMSILLLLMILLPIKMILRWTLDLGYIVSIKEWFLKV